MKKGKPLSLEKQNARAGYLFSLPFLIGFFLFFLYPVLQSIVMSFNDVVTTQNGMKLVFNGIGFYKNLFTADPDFLRVYLSGTLSDLAIQFPSILIFSFFIAVLLNQKFKGRTFARVIFFLPVIISSGVILLVQNNQLQSVTMSNVAGSAAEISTTQLTESVMKLVKNINIGPGIVDFVRQAVGQIYVITVSSGIQILIYLAGLQTIPSSIYEASSIEGASGWENFWKITFPMISPMILVNGLYTIIDSLSGMNNKLIGHIYHISFVSGKYSYGASMSWVYFAIIGVIVAVFLFLTSRFVYYENN